MYVCVCTCHVGVCTCMYVHPCVRVCGYMYKYYMDVWCAYTCKHVHVHVHACTYVHVCVCIRACVWYEYMYTCAVCTCTCVHAQIMVWQATIFWFFSCLFKDALIKCEIPVYIFGSLQNNVREPIHIYVRAGVMIKHLFIIPTLQRCSHTIYTILEWYTSHIILHQSLIGLLSILQAHWR